MIETQSVAPSRRRVFLAVYHPGDPAGVIVRVVSSMEAFALFALAHVREGEAAIEIDGPIDTSLWRVLDGQLVPLPGVM